MTDFEKVLLGGLGVAGVYFIFIRKPSSGVYTQAPAPPSAGGLVGQVESGINQGLGYFNQGVGVVNQGTSAIGSILTTSSSAIGGLTSIGNQLGNIFGGSSGGDTTTLDSGGDFTSIDSGGGDVSSFDGGVDLSSGDTSGLYS